LAKLQSDVEPGIRANANICLGKISVHLSPSSRQKVLITAFARGLRDPFPPSRVASLQSLGATAELFDVNDVASKIIPCISSVLVDPERTVRDQAFVSLEIYVSRLKLHAEKIPDTRSTIAVEDTVGETTSKSNNSNSFDTANWGGWAMDKLTNSLVDSSVEPSNSNRNSGSGSFEIMSPTKVVARGIETKSVDPFSQLSNGWSNEWDTLDVNTQSFPKITPPPSKIQTSGLSNIASFGNSSKVPSGSMKLCSKTSASKLMADINSSLSKSTISSTGISNTNDSWGNNWGDIDIPEFDTKTNGSLI
jgi:SCY1-like protein 1